MIYVCRLKRYKFRNVCSDISMLLPCFYILTLTRVKVSSYKTYHFHATAATTISVLGERERIRMV